MVFTIQFYSEYMLRQSLSETRKLGICIIDASTYAERSILVLVLGRSVYFKPRTLRVIQDFFYWSTHNEYQAEVR
jgi:hypothetical protein